MPAIPGKRKTPLQGKEAIMGFELPELPYPKNALEPHISARTMEFHHGKHHNTYVTTANQLIQGTSFEGQPLEEVIRKTMGDAEKTKIFNNAAQVWNHTFFWNCMKPDGGGAPTGTIAERIRSDFGSHEKFAEALKNAGTTQFGSGWAWLVLKEGKLEVIKTANADTPIAHGIEPVLTVDVWEHAYYLDYQNKRADFLDAFIGNLINWDFANSRMESLMAMST
jgi:superoxide dismutase, Fe-Mn family